MICVPTVRTVEISNGELASALVNGSPALFEQTRSTAGRLVKGHASTIDYEVAGGHGHADRGCRAE